VGGSKGSRNDKENEVAIILFILHKSRDVKGESRERDGLHGDHSRYLGVIRLCFLRRVV